MTLMTMQSFDIAHLCWWSHEVRTDRTCVCVERDFERISTRTCAQEGESERDTLRPILCMVSAEIESGRSRKRERERERALYGAKVGGLIWIRFAAEALRFSFAKSSRPTQEMWKYEVKLTIISRFELFQIFATQKSRIHGPLSEVVHGNWGTLTSTKSLNVC